MGCNNKKRVKKLAENSTFRKLQLYSAEIQRIIRDYYEKLYGNKMDNLEEMDRFFKKFNLSRLNQEETEIMNNPITSTEIEAVIKYLPKNKA